MNMSIEEHERLTDKMCDLKIEIILLRGKLQQAEDALQQKTSECEQLKEELCNAKSVAGRNVNLWTKEDYIVISLKKLRKFLAGIKETQLVGFIIFLMQKLLPKEADVTTMKLIAETAPEEIRSDISISAEGDVNVAGSYNHFQNNNNVTLQNP